LSHTFEKPWGGTGIGGSPALDFANTVDWRLRETPTDSLHGFDDLLFWAWSAGIYSRAEARRLQKWAKDHPRAAQSAFTAARRLREAIASVFQAIAHGKAIAEAPLSEIEQSCREAWVARKLERSNGGAEWGWRADAPAAERARLSVALDAARILTSSDREHVRQCGDAQCGWLFVDSSRNRKRRWCTMEGCGNRNKARNFYRRSRET
jgi:predicted RNA-binding Zn ribbon-like protein